MTTKLTPRIITDAMTAAGWTTEGWTMGINDGAEFRRYEDTVVIYWDEQDPSNPGYAWRNVLGGSLDTIEQLAELAADGSL